MSTIERCPHCDTPLAFANPHHDVRFTGHTTAFCAAATRQRVRDLTAAVQCLHETYARRVRLMNERVDELLERAGAPSLAERERAAQLEALRVDLRAVLVPPTPQALDDLADRPWRLWDGRRWRHLSQQELDHATAAAREAGVDLLVLGGDIAEKLECDPAVCVAVRGDEARRCVAAAHDRHRRRG